MIIPSFLAQLRKYQQLVSLTIHDLKVGADELELIKQERKKEIIRKEKIRKAVHIRAKNKKKLQNKTSQVNSFMRSLGLKMEKNKFKSGTRAQSYKNARMKLESVDIEDPLYLIDLIENQESTYLELKEQINDLNIIKNDKLDILEELKLDLHGKVFSSSSIGDDDGEKEYNLLGEKIMTSFTDRGDTTNGATTDGTGDNTTPPLGSVIGRKRASKQDRIEESIHKGAKILLKSRNKLKKVLHLISSVKAGTLHLLKLLKLKSLYNELENISEEDNINLIQENRNIKNLKNNSKRMRSTPIHERDTIKDVLLNIFDVLEEKLGNITDTANIIKKSSKNRSRRKSTSTGRDRSSSISSNIFWWDPEKDDKLIQVKNQNTFASPNERNHHTFGSDGLVFPRRPVSRIISMRLKEYERGRMNDISNERHDEEEKWWIDGVDDNRNRRIENIKKEKKRKQLIIDREIQLKKSRQKEYEDALAKERKVKQLNIDERRMKKEKRKKEKQAIIEKELAIQKAKKKKAKKKNKQ